MLKSRVRNLSVILILTKNVLIIAITWVFHALPIRKSTANYYIYTQVNKVKNVIDKQRNKTSPADSCVCTFPIKTRTIDITFLIHLCSKINNKNKEQKKL